MSTRANVVIIKEGCENVCLYHHHDGYPSGVGKGLTDFMGDISESEDEEKILETPQSLGEWLTSDERDDEYENDGYGLHGDIEYLYIINLDGQYINCYDAWNWDENLFESDAINGKLPLIYHSSMWDCWSEVKREIDKERENNA